MLIFIRRHTIKDYENILAIEWAYIIIGIILITGAISVLLAPEATTAVIWPITAPPGKSGIGAFLGVVGLIFLAVGRKKQQSK